MFRPRTTIGEVLAQARGQDFILGGTTYSTTLAKLRPPTRGVTDPSHLEECLGAKAPFLASITTLLMLERDAPSVKT